LKHYPEENHVPFAVGTINLNNLFKTLWQVKQGYLADAVQRTNAIGDLILNNPPKEVGKFA
jgi:hypothetical protein